MADSIGDSIAVTFCFQAVRKQEEVKEPVKVLDFDRDEESQSEMGADKKKSDLEELFRKDPVDDQGEKEKEDDDNEIEEDNMEQVLGFDRVKKSKSGTSTSSDKKNGLKDFFRKASQRWR